MAQSSLKEGVALSLPLKIAGLVFWGLVSIGIVLVVISIDILENDLRKHYDNTDFQTYTLTRELFEQATDVSAKNLKASLKKVVESTGATGLTVITENFGQINVGSIKDVYQVKTIYFSSKSSKQKSAYSREVTLKIYQEPIQNVLNQQKKKLITTMLFVLIVFGILLQWILKKLLSEPIQQMVDAAQAFSLGEEVKFDDKRNDEFGYLSLFINKALTTITKRQDELTHQATHDKLTGLYNRHEFDIRLNQFLELAKTEGLHSTLCYMDLDQFKIINGTCGHVAGDELLKQISHSLKSEVRESDFIARLGGDEFAVLFQGCVEEDAIRLATKLLKVVEQFHFTWEGRVFHIGVSIGVASITSDIESATDILGLADVACYTAKDKGRNQIHIYQPEDKELKRKQGEMLWASQIRQALKEDSFALYQQLIIPTNPESPLKNHYEILLRVPDEKGNLISPVKFIRVAELYGLMTNIDEWVVRNCFDWMIKNKSTMNNIEQMSINLSGQSLTSKQFLDTIIELIENNNLQCEKICFEITETNVISNFESAINFIYSLKSHGCKFSLDDFGSGMSSFSYLKTLDVDYLKIDGSYVHNITNNPIDKAMVEAVNKIGHAMGIQTIAEYVEDKEILQMLEEIGVDYAQGEGIAYPSPLNDLCK